MALSIEEIKNYAIAALTSIILGGGSAVGIVATTNVRHDPWTGTNAKEANTLQDIRMSEIKRDHKEMMRAFSAHLTRGEAGFQRIARLEQDYQELVDSLQLHNTESNLIIADYQAHARRAEGILGQFENLRQRMTQLEANCDNIRYGTQYMKRGNDK